MCHIFTHSSIGGRSGSSRALAAVNTAVRVSVLIRVFVFPGYTPRSGTAGSFGDSSFCFLRVLSLLKWFDQPEFEQALGVGDGHGSLACCSPWSHRVRHDSTTELSWAYFYIQTRSKSREGPCFTAPAEMPPSPFHSAWGCQQPPVAAFLGPPGSLFTEHSGLGDDVFLPEAFFFFSVQGFL